MGHRDTVEKKSPGFATAGRPKAAVPTWSCLVPKVLVFAGLFGGQVAGVADLVQVQTGGREFGDLAAALKTCEPIMPRVVPLSIDRKWPRTQFQPW
jgi:hypothetical protein